MERDSISPSTCNSLLLKNNGILRKNQTGEIEISQPDEKTYIGANKVWGVITDFLKKARQKPMEIKNLVNQLRKPPYGLKCRVMPVLFAAAAHRELAMGNISFEFQRTLNQVQKITIIESDSLEKIFSTPEKYKIAYIDVSSNQIAVISGLAKVYDVFLLPSDPALERVKKVGTAIGAWWRSQPKHAQITSSVSEHAYVVRDYIFKPLAELEPDTAQILLKDAFEYVFDAGKNVKASDVEKLIYGIKREFEELSLKLGQKIIDECRKVFLKEYDPYSVAETSDEENTKKIFKAVSEWFNNLSEEKRSFVHHGDPGILAAHCRDNPLIDEKAFLKLAEKLTGLQISSWSDEMIIKFSAKLDAAKEYIETFEPPSIPVTPPPIITDPVQPPPLPNQAWITHTIQGEQKKRIIEIMEELSPNGQALENMLNATVDQIGRSLDEKEKTAIIYRFMKKHFFN
ncbi:MAG: hypothetical protein HQK67_06770 [Desulfamplus sp.]|nr:hypothetical protein [Desulfamplus sp.]